MKNLLAIMLFCMIPSKTMVQTFGLPYKFPVYIRPMPNGLDVSLKKEIEKKAIFHSVAETEEGAFLVLDLRDGNKIVFELQDGSIYPTNNITLKESSLKDVQKGKTDKVAQRIVKEVGKLVNRWMLEDESVLLMEFGPPYQLIPLQDGGKALVWYSEKTTTTPGRSYSRGGGLRVCGSTGGNAVNPPKPIYCSGPVQTVVVPPKEKTVWISRMFLINKEGFVIHSATDTNYM
ncbi:MAG: hypothetical protein HY648_09150 [Acidobacteria bacterium]|nr:hypothetical protein [Acidobacteriota bacterium]